MKGKFAVIAARDRADNKDFKVSTTGRISKEDIQKALDGKLKKQKFRVPTATGVIQLLQK